MVVFGSCCPATHSAYLIAVRAGLEWLSNHRQPITMGPTRVLGKREETHRWGGSRASYRYDYYVSLELESTGERAEYKVPGSLWNTVAEGDTGTAKVQGTKLHWLRVNNPKARFVPGVYGGAETSAEHAAAEQGVPAPSGGDANRTHVPESTPVPVPHQSATPAVTTYRANPAGLLSVSCACPGRGAAGARGAEATSPLATRGRWRSGWFFRFFRGAACSRRGRAACQALAR